jgi:reverse gyrase
MLTCQMAGSVGAAVWHVLTAGLPGAAPQLSDALVHAYLARRGLDYLMGFHLSPLLWRKLSGARSAGRVQSVALRLVCEREVQVGGLRSAGCLNPS